MDEKTYPLSIVSTLTGIKKSTLKILGEQQLIDIRYSHDRLDANKLGYEIHSKTKSSDGRYKVISVIPIPQTELTRFQTWLEEHPEIERDLNNEPVIGIDQLIKDTGYSEMTILGMYQKGQINITGLSVNTSKKITSGCVTRLEYERLLDLSRSQQDKPTAEQLEATMQAQQEEIERLKAQLDNNEIKLTKQTQRELALKFWVQGKGGAEQVRGIIKKEEIHEALKSIDGLFQFSDFEKFWQKQQIIKL